jgi:hypothetical protein
VVLGNSARLIGATMTTFQGLGLIAAVALIALYFLPTIVAASRAKAHGGGGVFLVNLFFGWTLIGWLLAFVWACSGKTDADVRAEQRRHDELLAALRPPVTYANEREERRAALKLNIDRHDRVKF